MKKIFFSTILTLFLLLPSASWAANNSFSADYIKEFQSVITVNPDASFDITERILWDFGALEKHGIFRILPTFYQTEEGKISAPVKLISIADFDNTPINYQEIKNSLDGTVKFFAERSLAP